MIMKGAMRPLDRHALGGDKSKRREFTQNAVGKRDRLSPLFRDRTRFPGNASQRMADRTDVAMNTTLFGDDIAVNGGINAKTGTMGPNFAALE